MAQLGGKQRGGSPNASRKPPRCWKCRAYVGDCGRPRAAENKKKGCRAVGVAPGRSQRRKFDPILLPHVSSDLVRLNAFLNNVFSKNVFFLAFL